MKVLIINGSPRPKGNTALALAEVARQLEKNGIESEIVWIGNKPVRGCIACGKCYEKPGACVFNDDICNEISAKYAEADALIVGSPVYYGQPNGALLSIIQRSFHSNGANIAGKPAAAVAVCRRGGSTAAFQRTSSSDAGPGELGWSGNRIAYFAEIWYFCSYGTKRSNQGAAFCAQVHGQAD